MKDGPTPKRGRGLQGHHGPKALAYARYERDEKPKPKAPRPRLPIDSRRASGQGLAGIAALAEKLGGSTTYREPEISMAANRAMDECAKQRKARRNRRKIHA